MKKAFIIAAAALALGMTSCGGSADKNDQAADTLLSAATTDSIAQYYGRYVGNFILNDYSNFAPESRQEATKDDIVKGIQYILGANDSRGFSMGMQIGMQLQNELTQFKSQGINLDKDMVMRYFKNTFMADSIDRDQMQAVSDVFQRLMQQTQELSAKREEARKAQAPEAIQNAQVGKAYIEKMKSEDPEIKTSDSGLAYKIINKGDDTQIGDNTMVTVNYTGRFTDGKVFDTSEGRGPAKFTPSGVVKGFGEGLKMLGKGGKAVLYIPGDLAYGVNGAPQGGIGPNQTLVFDIEIVDVDK